MTVGRRALAAAMLLVGLAALVAAVPGVFVRATYGAHTTADEPHYLLTAISLAEDGDLDVGDELAAERYRPFHEADLPLQAAPQADGALRVPHDPLLPLYLAPAWWLGGWVGAKLGVAALAAGLAALTLWTAVRRFDAALVPATAAVGALSAAGTLAVYGGQLYPEVAAALAVAVCVAAATGPSRPATDATVVAGIVALPWLAVKYAPVAGVLTAVHLARRWRQGHRAVTVWTVLALGVAAAVYVGLHLRWYGGATVYAGGDFFREHGGQLSVVGTDPDYLGRARRLVGLLVDRDFGLAAWQPAFLLTVGGLAALGRARPAGTWLVLAPAAAGWLTATFVALTMQGFWFPGRQVVVVLPLLAIALARWASTRRWVLGATVVTGIAGLLTHGWLLVDGLARRLTLVVDFATVGNPLHQAWRSVLPNYLDVTTRTWVLHGSWTVALLALLVAGWRSAGTHERARA